MELDQKKLPNKVIEDLFEQARLHNGRILLIDLDETLIHAKYVSSKEQATFKLKLKDQKLDLLVRINFTLGCVLTILD